MRPRTMMLIMVIILGATWYVVEPTTGESGAIIRTPLPAGSVNPAPIILLVIVIVLAIWPWVNEFRRKRE